MTWARMKPWLKRWAGLTINTLGLLFFALYGVLEFAGTSVDWTNIVGEEKARIIVPAVLALNVFLRIVVTRTRGSPDA